MQNIPNAITKVGTIPQGAQAEGVSGEWYDTYLVGLSTALPAQYQLFQKGGTKSSQYQNFSLPVERSVSYKITHMRAVVDLRYSTPTNALSAEAYFENNSFVNWEIEDKVYPSIMISDLQDATKVVSNGAYTLRTKVTNKYQLQDPIEIGGDTRVTFNLNFPTTLTTAATAATNPYLPGSTGLPTTEGFSVRIILYGIQYRTIR